MRILRGDKPAGRSRKRIVVLVFQARKPLVVASGKADNRRREIAVWVVTLVVLNQVDDSLDAVLVLELVDEL